MKNYHYIRTIIVKIILNLIPMRYLYSIIDILSIKEFKKLFLLDYENLIFAIS